MSLAGAARRVDLAALGREESIATAAFFDTALPPELRPVFGASFVRSHILYGEFVSRLALAVLRESGLESALAQYGSVPEIAARAALALPQAVVPLEWMLRFLAARGLVDSRADGGQQRYAAAAPWPALDPGPVKDEQHRHDASWMPAYVLAETVAREYPAFLRGTISGEDVLFAPRRLRLWVDYFSNDHGLYAVNNRVGALAAERWLGPSGGAVLELGGGLGSGALALLERLESTGRLAAVSSYHFTEPVPAFLRRGEQAVRARYPERPALRFGPLDMNRPFDEQGVARGSVALVYAVNTLHVAHDLDLTLHQVFRALAPGGRLVISECVRPPRPIYAEFVFNLIETFRAPRLHPRHRPHGGFMRPAHWQAALESAGFEDVRFMPDIARIQEVVPDFGVAAIGALRPGERAKGVC